jgi:hypothetical protein
MLNLLMLSSLQLLLYESLSRKPAAAAVTAAMTASAAAAAAGSLLPAQRDGCIRP